MNDVDRCLICGEVIPEGSQVCTACRNKYDIANGETEEMAQELRGHSRRAENHRGHRHKH